MSTVLYYTYLHFQYKNVDVDDMIGGQQDEFYQSLVNIVNNMFSYIDYMDQDQEAFLQNINDCKVFLEQDDCCQYHPRLYIKELNIEYDEASFLFFDYFFS